MIELRDVTPENHLEVRSLSVHPHQTKFVASVDKSLADAFVWKGALVKAGYYKETSVGFVMLFQFEENDRRIINVVRFLIDARYQGKGLGRQLLSKTLKWIDSLAVDRIRISTLPDNEIALSLYKEFGFIESGIEDGEIALYMKKLRNA